MEHELISGVEDKVLGYRNSKKHPPCRLIKNVQMQGIPKFREMRRT
jgi:hypothetical protein